MSQLFTPLTIHSLTFPNRIGLAPMSQFSSENGFANDWHYIHLGSRAVGGAGLIMAESTAVSPEGRMTSKDLGIWSDDHVEALARITQFVQAQGSIAGIQIGHAGRKASCYPHGSKRGSMPAAEGGWQPLAPSAIAYDDEYTVPMALTTDGIAFVVQAFEDGARRARDAGFRVLEIHASQGFLIHEFLSPLANHRQDEYGGTFEGRIRILREVIQAVRKEWPEHLPLFTRINATDGAEGGWDIEQAVALSAELKALGVDLIVCASGSVLPKPALPTTVDYQRRFTQRVRIDVGIMTAAIGMITSAQEANHIIEEGNADMVLLAREFLRDPYWPLHAAQEIGDLVSWPMQYLAGAPDGTPPRQPH